MVKAVGEDRHHDLGAHMGAVVSREGNMKLTPDQQASAVESLAEQTVVAACALADAVDSPESWSASAVEDAAAALEVLAGALTQLDPECAEILSVVPAAAAAVLERVEHARTDDGTQGGGGEEYECGGGRVARRDACPSPAQGEGQVRDRAQELEVHHLHPGGGPQVRARRVAVEPLVPQWEQDLRGG
ncbi:hypothetical protein WEB32_00240 [Streptomyces netropsis]|uniref:hypothetical protein n=1 Tax=Streptomyces netropsis TaxID=55404 RepID=UPI0030CE1BA2